jgi:hypothetical protein
MKKICSICQFEKETREFHKDSKGKLGVRSECKKCTSIKDQRYRENNTDKIKNRMTQWRSKNKVANANSKAIYNQTPKGIWVKLKGHKANGKYEFNICENEFYEWLNNNELVCEYCKLNIQEIEKIHKLLDLNRTFKRMEVDRMDSNKGYMLSNIVLACHICNRHKKDFFTHEEFLEIAGDYLIPKFKKILNAESNKSIA